MQYSDFLLEVEKGYPMVLLLERLMVPNWELSLVVEKENQMELLLEHEMGHY